MATQDTRAELIEIVVAMFDAAPGVEVLSDLEAAYDAGNTNALIAASLANSAEFKSIFQTENNAELNNSEFVSKFVDQMVGSLVLEAQKTEVKTALTAEMNAGATRVDVVLTAVDALKAIPTDDAVWGNASAAFANKVEVATYHTVEKQQATTTLADLQAVLASVDNTAASVTSAKAELDDSAKAELDDKEAAAETITLTESLEALSAANSAKPDFLAANANNEFLGYKEDSDPTNADVEADIAIKNGDADDAVATAEDGVLDAQAGLAVARNTTFDEYDGGVANGNLSGNAVLALDAVSGTTKMSDANLAAAATEAQADVDDDEDIYASDGTVLAEGTEELIAVYEIGVDSDVAAETELEDGDLITEQFAGTQQTTTVNFGEPIEDKDVSITVNGEEFTATADENGNIGTDLEDAIETKFPGFEVSLVNDGGEGEDETILTVTGLAGASFTVVDALVDGTEVEDAIELAEEALTAAEIIADEKTVLVGYTDGEIAIDAQENFDATAVGLGDTVTEASLLGNTDPEAFDTTIGTAAEWQAAIATAEVAVTAFVTANGDNEALLDAVRDSINAHIGAGGENDEFDNAINGNVDLLALRDAIAALIDDEDDVDEVDVDNLVAAIADEEFAFEADEGETLTAQQTAVNNAFAATEERVELDADVVAAENAFGDITVGAIFGTIVALQEERDTLIEALSDAETDLSDAQADAVAIQALVDQLADLNEDITDALAAIQDADPAGLGIALLEGDDNFTEGDDLYLFKEDGGAKELTGFGDEGVDRIFFGEGYTLVEIEDINTNVGDAAVLEILWQEVSGNLELYVETETFGGNVTGEANEIVTITLIGFSADDITGFEGGFLTAGTAA